MGTDSEPPGSARPSAPRIGGTPVDVLLAAALPRLARRMVAAFAAQVPAYAALPREELAGDVTRGCEHGTRVVVRALRHGAGMADPAEVAPLAASAARRAEEGVPLSAVLCAYHLGWQLGLDELLSGAGPGDLAAVVETQRIALTQLRLATRAVTDAYLDAREALHGHEQAARHDLLAALLDGRDATEAAARAGLRPAPAYVALALAFADHPDEALPGTGGAVAARRKVRRARAEVDHDSRGGALHALGPHGGRVLLPTDDPGRALGEDWGRLVALVARLADRTGAPVLAGAAAAAPGDVPAAVGESEEVLDVARAFGRPPGAYRVADVLLDYQLTRPGAGRDRLAALLTPLERQPALLDTLRAYADSGFRRRATAKALHIHPNTVDYRLRRVTVLTGLDPTLPAELPRLRAALAAHRHGGT
ncbi:helix-turn-helix domain-containing protein [Streptomyces sp. NPDC052114]|uniref:PucR family transcriptional regulator n=1 Tax=unclassified Streptomyces TaxID=2593676 RepID=UPI00343EDC15